jgi:hypothetical protein
MQKTWVCPKKIEGGKLNSNESLLYTPICHWLEKLLRNRYKRFKIIVANTSNIRLNSWLQKENLLSFFPDGLCYDFKIDITGIILQPKRAGLYFIECKASYITIKDLCQILGYSIIASPVKALIISPKGPSTILEKLITVHGRIDILNYPLPDHKNSLIRICKWDNARNTLDYNFTIPLGCHP